MRALGGLVACLTAGVLTIVVAGCEADSPRPSQEGRSPGQTPDPGHGTVAEAERVVAISVDGLNPGVLAALGEAGTPVLHSMLDEGAGTLNARSARELTLTLPNHTGMMTGRRVDGPDGHHVRFNEDTGGTLEQLNGTYVAGIFDAVHDAGGSTALYTSKEKLELLARSWDEHHGAPDTTGGDDGTDKLDDVVLEPQSRLVPDLVERLRTAQPRLTFLHLAAPDVALHASGCMSSDYADAVRETDSDIGAVLDTIRGDPDLRTTTDVVLTADHGCRPGTNGHYDPADPANYTVPFVVWGPGVSPGADLYALNPDRQDPGQARTSYRGPQPIRNLDLAPLVTSLLSRP